MPLIESEASLIRVARDLGAPDFGGPVSAKEQALLAQASGEPTRAESLDVFRKAIVSGVDPLGDAYCSLRTSAVRRLTGAVYTPPDIVRPMVDWVLGEGPARVVDAGAGSGRFTLEIARRDPSTPIVAIDLDPMATLMTRAGLAVLGRRQAIVKQADFTSARLDPIDGRTAYIGNPPYVRHHDLTPQLKAWAQQAARRANVPMSGLAGLHAYFFLATVLAARSEDIGCFVTSGEWLDVNYGSIVRKLLLDGLGGQSVHVLEPTVRPFGNAATTAVITCFRVGQAPDAVRVRSVASLADIEHLDGGEPIERERLAAASRWTVFVRHTEKPPAGYVELGELCQVHRGTVTGRNAVWITKPDDHRLPESVLVPTITRARELFEAGESLGSTELLRRVIDLPRDLDELDQDARRAVERFLREAKSSGAAEGYIASNRKAWWSVGLRAPAPILATYMARKPPAFVRNLVGARHINIAHGLYPRQPLADQALDRLAQALRTSTVVSQGRTYAGGLTKFEPKEMERLPVPDLPQLLG
ncbi:MAG TPA: class I SAM-dependent methyltransferase [Chloroflexota bacterium]